MTTLNLRAHFDGTHILLDEPFPLRPNTKLLVTVLAEVEDDDDVWRRMAVENLQRAYGHDEPEYPLELIKEANPDYERR